MTKITLTDLANLENLTAVSAINANNAILETALDNTLSRDGTTPNQMEAVLDMNSHRIINLPAADSGDQPVRKAEFDLVSNGYTGNNTLLGTNHEINITSGSGTSTFSLPSGLTFTGKTVTNGTYTTPILTTPSMSGTPDANTSKFIADGANIINASDHGVGTGVADNGVPLNTLIASLPNGSIIVLPRGALNFSTTINLDGRTCITLRGQGGQTTGSTVGTTLNYTPAVGTGIRMGDATTNCWLDGLQIISTNASFTGTLIRCGGTGAGAVPQMNRVYNCFIFALGGTGIDLDQCIEFAIRDCCFAGLTTGISGCLIPSSFSGIVSIEQCQFINTIGAGAYIRNAGTTWSIDECTFEARTDGVGVAIVTDPTYSTYNMTVSNCWFGDVTVAGGIWIANFGTAYGLTVTSSFFGGYNSGSTNVAIAIAAGEGIVVKGNEFNGFSTVITANASHFVDLSPNNFTNCALRSTTLGAANPGFHMLPNGLMMQYGTTAVTTGTPVSITFAVPFSDTPYNVQATLSTPVNGDNTTYSTLITATTMSINVAGTAGANTVHWTAIGQKQT